MSGSRFQRRTLGRPPRDPALRLARTISVAISTDQYEQLRREQDAADYRSLSAFIRERKLGLGF